MATIRDVAKKAEVSIAAVSRVLKQDASFRVTDDTRRRILRAAQELHYAVPGARASEPIQIGCVLALTVGKYSDPFFTGILAAAEEECSRCNAVITAVRNYSELSDPQVLADLCGLGLSGIILMEELPPEILQPILDSTTHVVAVVDQPEYRFDGVGFDHAQANWQVMDCLIARGYRRIAHIGGSSPGQPLQQSVRMMVYRECLRRSGIPYEEALVKDCNWDLDLCARQARELLSMENPPDAIFAGSDSLASAILGTVYAMGLRCPEDIGVIGFNNIPLSAHMAPPLTTVNIPEHEIGVAIVRLLMEQVNGVHAYQVPRKILFPTELVLRGSLRPAPASLAPVPPILSV